MKTIYQSGIPRYYIDDGSVFEHGTVRLAFYIKDNVVYACDGTPVYWIEEGVPACYLHAYDGSPPSLYFDAMEESSHHQTAIDEVVMQSVQQQRYGRPR